MSSISADQNRRLYFFFGLLVIYAFLTIVPVFAQQDVGDAEYRPFPKIGSRNAVWIAAQLHLLFGSFILGVPMFAVVIEFVGVKTKDRRYDKMAQEFIKLCMGAFSTTALLGGVLVFVLIWCYPKVMNKMTGIFGPTMIFYVFLFFAETFTLYLYSYGWDRMQGKASKMWHLLLGVLLNVFGTAIMFVSNSWLTYQTSPALGWSKVSEATREKWLTNNELPTVLSKVENPRALENALGELKKVLSGVADQSTSENQSDAWEKLLSEVEDPSALERLLSKVEDPNALEGLLSELEHVPEGILSTIGDGERLATLLKEIPSVITLHRETGEFFATVWEAVNNFTWMPINIHRLIGNVAFGGAIVGAYSAFRFLVAKTQEEKAHYDWMGYTGNFIALCGLIPLPFAGYWLGREIYMFNQTMGINMMGSLFSWLFIIQAVMIGVLFISANYYLWSGMTRIEGGEKFARYRPYMITVVVLCVAIWMTPRTLIMTPKELAAIGGPNHPLVGFFGLMTAKNTVVNIIILTTFLSFLFYRRSGKTPTASWSRAGNFIIAAIFGLAVAVIVAIGIAGFKVPSDLRVNILTPVQVLIALAVMISVTVIDLSMYRKAMSASDIRWGQMTDRSQYVLILIAITFTSLMGLMGYARSGLRENWHIFGVLPDTSSDSFTPPLSDAVNVIAVIMVIFFALVGFIFWIGLWGEKKKAVEVAMGSRD